MRGSGRKPAACWIGMALAGALAGIPIIPARAQEAETAMAVPMPGPALSQPGLAQPGLAQPGPVPPSGAVPMLPPLPVLDDRSAFVEFYALRHRIAAEVPHLLTPSAAARARTIALAQAQLAQAGRPLDRPQLIVVVDRNPRVQTLTIVMTLPDAPWQVLGATRVSTGQTGRKFYYITPTGVFPHNGDILDYRAEGTFNENHIRGLGLKGMRVWDFGWQWAAKGWRDDREKGQIRMEMHATDPTYLESRIGRPASEGCIRIPAALNRFMDRHGVLDADYRQQAIQDIRYRAVLPLDATPTPLAGDMLVVIDSGEG